VAIRGEVFRAGGIDPVPVARDADVQLSLHDALAGLEREWCAFEQLADCTVFQTFGWLAAWHLHIGTGKGVRPAVVIGRNAAGEILFLLPLAVESKGFARRLTWLGSDSSDYNAPLLAPDFPRAIGTSHFPSLWPRILDRVQRERDLQFDLVHFVRMPATVGRQPNPFVRLPVMLHPSGAYLAHLGSDWATFYAASRSSATRRREVRKRKHLAELGEVRLVTPQDGQDIVRSFDTLIAQKTRSFAAAGVPNLFRRPGHAEFYRSLAINAGTRHIAHVSRLDVGTVAAAAALGLVFRGRYHLVLSSYDGGEIARFSPGSVHLHELMRHAIATGCTVFDFTVGDEAYKRDWSEPECALCDHVSAVRWRGACVAPVVRGFTRVKRLVKRTPLLWSAFSKLRSLVARAASRCRA
jgi:CelD/BcsL family acetyltransferase involved in cellulose biosynthesis